MNIFKPYLGQNASVYIQNEKKSEHISVTSTTIEFQLRSVSKESDEAIRRMESRSAKRAECGFPHFTARYYVKSRRRNRALALRDVASHAGYLKLTRDILSLSSLQDQYENEIFRQPIRNGLQTVSPRSSWASLG